LGTENCLVHHSKVDQRMTGAGQIRSCEDVRRTTALTS
jgi:hypothetical protein